MKVLHIFNVAGVASVIAKFMDRNHDVNSCIITRKASDPYGFTSSENYEVVNDGAWRFSLRCLWKARKFDIIHLHDFDKLLPWLSRFYDKPLILHYHGSRVRNQWKQRQHYWKHATKILYSTSDLKQTDTPTDAIYLPNPVDTSMFHPLHTSLKKTNSALSMTKDLDSEMAKQLAEKNGLTLTIHNCDVPHKEMSSLLNQYDYYIDTKTTGYPMSKTGLEALACDLKVINRRGEVIEKLPEEHNPENICEKLHQIYEDIL